MRIEPDHAADRCVAFVATPSGEEAIRCNRIILRLGAVPPATGALPELSPDLESSVPGLYIIEADGAPSARNLLDNVLQAGVDGEYLDYLGAEQAVMAIDLLLMDAGVAQRHHDQRDELFHLVRSDEVFRARPIASPR